MANDREFATLLTISADTPAQLRRCDVYRVVDAAQDAGMNGFNDWLVAQRPDLQAAVDEAVADLAA